MSTQQDIIKAFMKHLDDSNDGGKNIDAAFKAASSKNSKRSFNSMQDVIDSFVNDLKSAKSVDDFLNESCGIYLDNMDKGAITGIEAGGTQIKTLTNIINEPADKFVDLAEDYRNQKTLNPDKKTFTLNEDATLSSNGTLSFTKNGLNVHVPKYDKIISDAYNGNETARKKLTVINGLYSWWIEEALRINQETYGDNFTFTNKNATATNIRVDLDYTVKDVVAAVGSDDPLWDDWSHLHLLNTDKNTYKLCLYINLNYFDRTDLQNDDKKEDALVHTIVHEFTHGIMQSNINYFSSLPEIITEGTAELTRGNYSGYSERGELYKEGMDDLLNNYLNDESNNSNLTKVIKDASSKDYLDDGDLKKTQYNFGFMLLRYFAKQCATEDISNSSISILQANKTVTGSSEKGQLFKANNGTASILKGDKITTDSEGNINKIIINNENHIVATPESKSSVIIENTDKKQIAWISGSANINGSGNYITSNFTPISVTSDVDKVTINGSWGNDLIYANGDQVSVTGVNGDDTIHVSGYFATINHSNQNAYDGNVKEIVVNGDYAYVTGSGSSKYKVTLNGSYAKGIEEKVIMMSYGGDTITYTGGIFTGDSDDEILVNGDYNNIQGMSGNDTLIVNGNNNSVFGGDGDNFFTIKGTKNYIEGDDGKDKFSISGESNTLFSFQWDKDKLYFKESEISAEQITSEIHDFVVVIKSGGKTILTIYEDSGTSTEDNVYYDNGQKHTTLGQLLMGGSSSPDTSDSDPRDSDPSTLKPDPKQINGSEGNDSINNTIQGATINSGAGNDSIYNQSDNVSIDAGSDNDEIGNSGDSVTITGGNGDDTIINYGSNVIIDDGAGDGYIGNGGSNVTIDGGDNNDIIKNTILAKNIIVNAGNGDDSINNYGEQITINGDTGNDSIDNWGESIKIDGGSGDDIINNAYDVYYGKGENVTIDAGDGNDSISNNAYDVTINAGDGNDFIKTKNPTGTSREKTNIIIDSGAGNDSIYNQSDNISIDAGSDNDDIDNSGDSVTITGGDGDDSIHNSGYNATIDGSDGNDSIYNSDNNVSINGGDDNDSIHNSGYNATIDGGNGNDYLYNANQNVTIDAGEGNDVISNNSKYASITGGAGNDSIKNFGYSVKIVGGIGDDSIENNGDNVTIDAGEGNDIISNNDEYSSFHASINGGAGNDTISNYYDLATINGGDDNDLINSYNPSASVIAEGGAGNDTISNKSRSSSINGGVDNDFISNNAWYVTIEGGDGDDSISNNYCEYVTISGGKGNDSIYLNSWYEVIKYTLGDGNDIIEGFNTTITLSISGGAYSTTKSGDDVIVNIGEGSVTLEGAADLKKVNIIGAEFIDDSDSDSDTNPADNDIWIADKSIKSPVTLSPYISIADASSHTHALQITGNDLDNSIVGGKGADTICGNSGKNTLTGGKGKDIFVYNGSNDLITDYEKGKDKISLDSSLISDFTLDNKNLILASDDNTFLTINNAANKQISFLNGSKTTKIVFTSNASLDGSEKGATLTSSATEFSAANYSKIVTINAESVSSAVSITGNSKANRIIAGNNGSTLNGGKGKDTLFGGNGTDIFLYNNKSGNKVIQNYSSDDIISLTGAQIANSYVKSNDVILKTGNKKLTVKDAANKEIIISEDGSTKFFSAGIIYNQDKTSAILHSKFSSKSEKIFDDTVNEIDASDVRKKLALTSSNTTSTTIYGGRNKDALTGNFGNDLIYGGKGNDSIYGNSGDDSLFGDKGNDKLFGGTGADSLWGGKGNDTLYGDDGSDTFFYSKGDGKDVIFNFSDDDLLQVSGTFSAYYNNNKNEVSFKVASTPKAITLKDFSASSFNVNGNSYKISGNTLIKK